MVCEIGRTTKPLAVSDWILLKKGIAAVLQSTSNYWSMAVNDLAIFADLTGNSWSITHITGYNEGKFI